MLVKGINKKVEKNDSSGCIMMARKTIRCCMGSFSLRTGITASQKRLASLLEKKQRCQLTAWGGWKGRGVLLYVDMGWA